MNNWETVEVKMQPSEMVTMELEEGGALNSLSLEEKAAYTMEGGVIDQMREGERRAFIKKATDSNLFLTVGMRHLVELVRSQNSLEKLALIRRVFEAHFDLARNSLLTDRSKTSELQSQ